MKKRHGLWRLLLVAAGLTLVGACASKPPPPPPPTIVELALAASADVNPGPDGTASPIVVRVYQLGSTGAFEKADFFQLTDQEARLLGPDLVAKDQVILTPGQQREITLNPKPEAKAIGITAAYRDIDKAVWRASVPVPPNKTTKVNVAIEKLKLTATETE